MSQGASAHNLSNQALISLHDISLCKPLSERTVFTDKVSNNYWWAAKIFLACELVTIWEQGQTKKMQGWCFCCRQTEMLQQQVADASAASDQQKQSHQRTLALLDQAHLAQLSELQKQLLQQSTCHSEAETELKAQLVEQTDLTQQLRRAMTDLELDHQSLKRKSAEEQAVTKMLLKQQADSAAQIPSMQDTKPATECTVTDIHTEDSGAAWGRAAEFSKAESAWRDSEWAGEEAPGFCCCLGPDNCSHADSDIHTASAEAVR